jgi:hypothetical protein
MAAHAKNTQDACEVQSVEAAVALLGEPGTDSY